MRCCAGATGRLEWHYIESGKLVRDAFIESFNSKLRDECLKEYVFTILGEARAIIEAWRHDYNHLRSHSSLGALTPSEFEALKRKQTTLAATVFRNRTQEGRKGSG